MGLWANGASSGQGPNDLASSRTSRANLQMVSAAVWERHFSDGLESPRAARGGRLLRRVLLQCGEAGSAAAALEALLGPGSVRRVAAGGGDGGVEGQEGCGGGVVPDLAHESFQDIDPLVF